MKETAVPESLPIPGTVPVGMYDAIMETVMECVSAMCRPRNAAPANCEGRRWEAWGG